MSFEFADSVLDALAILFPQRSFQEGQDSLAAAKAEAAAPHDLPQAAFPPTDRSPVDHPPTAIPPGRSPAGPGGTLIFLDRKLPACYYRLRFDFAGHLPGMTAPAPTHAGRSRELAFFLPGQPVDKLPR